MRLGARMRAYMIGVFERVSIVCTHLCARVFCVSVGAPACGCACVGVLCACLCACVCWIV